MLRAAAAAAAGATALPLQCYKLSSQNQSLINPNKLIRNSNSPFLSNLHLPNRQNHSKSPSVKCLSTSSGFGASDQSLPPQDPTQVSPSPLLSPLLRARARNVYCCFTY